MTTNILSEKKSKRSDHAFLFNKVRKPFLKRAVNFSKEY